MVLIEECFDLRGRKLASNENSFDYSSYKQCHIHWILLRNGNKLVRQRFLLNNDIRAIFLDKQLISLFSKKKLPNMLLDETQNRFRTFIVPLGAIIQLVMNNLQNPQPYMTPQPRQ